MPAYELEKLGPEEREGIDVWVSAKVEAGDAQIIDPRGSLFGLLVSYKVLAIETNTGGLFVAYNSGDRPTVAFSRDIDAELRTAGILRGNQEVAMGQRPPAPPVAG